MPVRAMAPYVECHGEGPLQEPHRERRGARAGPADAILPILVRPPGHDGSGRGTARIHKPQRGRPAHLVHEDTAHGGRRGGRPAPRREVGTRRSPPDGGPRSRRRPHVAAPARSRQQPVELSSRAADDAPEAEPERRILRYLSTGGAARARQPGAQQTSRQAATLTPACRAPPAPRHPPWTPPPPDSSVARARSNGSRRPSPRAPGFVADSQRSSVARPRRGRRLPD